jgi:solute carrier family 27 fatty acid transporter 1/4
MSFLRKVLLEIYHFVRIITFTILNLNRDVKGARVLKNIKKKLNYIDKKDICVADYFIKFVGEQPNKPLIIFNETIWTFLQFESYSNKIANLFSNKYNLKKGDVVAIFMENKPEYIALWYGLSKLGVISALINSNLRSKILIHSIEIAKPKCLVYGQELREAVAQVKNEFTLKFDILSQGDSTNSEDNLENLVQNQSDDFSMTEKVLGSDILMFVYTSGTTGLPKPAVIKHNRFIAAGLSFFDSAGLTKDDVFLVTLPIYHSNAGCIGVGAGLASGATIILRKKFSATNFWKECIQYKVTAFSYVGEVCRYLVNQPPSELDKAHSVRVCIGNGTRANIHREFSERFNIKCIEIYGATEGNCTLINTAGKYGACGYIPQINRYLKVLPYYVIKIDKDMNPLRDEDGFCVECMPNEVGLIVGEIIAKSTKNDYSGYANSDEASNKKIIKNLFKPNQNAFNSGDLVRMDNHGWIYFIDRIGDTFRWRGENVSTVEVENVISSRINSKV